MPYNAYVVAYMGAPRNHHAIFIETDKDGAGTLYHVKGDIQRGMEFESRWTKKPETSHTFESITSIGVVSSSDLSRVLEICKSNPPPEKQFNGPRKIDKNKPLRRCQEWTAETIQMLKDQGVLQAGSGGGSSTRK